MKTYLLPCLLVLAAATALPGLAHAEENARVIVRFKPAADSVRAKALAAHMGLAEAIDVAQTRATALGLRTGMKGGAGLRARMSLDARTHVFTATGLDSATLAKRLAQDSEVELVAVDQRRRHFVVPNDPFYANGPAAGPAVGQWYLKAPSSVPGEVVSSINAPAAWDVTTGHASVVVAVLDTGVRMDHPDLNANIVRRPDDASKFGGYDMVANDPVSGDGTAGRDADGSDPGDWVSQADVNGGALGSGCTADDISASSWHGTRVSGLIAATSNNGLGMAGVGWGIKILPVRVLGKCGGFDSDIMAGMRWAAGIAVSGLPTNPNPAKVINMSLGGGGSCSSGSSATLYKEAINQVVAQGATIVVAAGNSTGQAVGLPGNCPGVITVTGLRHVGSKVGFSSIGPEVSIAAPGGNCVNLTGACLYPMFSTTNSGSTTPVANDNAYTNGDASVGTSFSTPIVSGVVALMLSVRPSMTSTEVLALLRSTARPFVSTGASPGTAQCAAPNGTEQLECYCTTSTCGAGMLDAAAAVKATQAANGAQIVIAATPASPTAGQTITVSAAGSTVGTGRSIASAAWTLVDGGGAVSGFASASNGISTTLTPTVAGTISLRVQLTDDLGVVHTGSSSIVVAAAPAVVTPPTSSGGGGGGGAMGAGWLLGLLAGALALRRR